MIDKESDIDHCFQSLQTMDGKYEWKIDDGEMVERLKSAENGKSFISPFFEIDGNGPKSNKGHLIKWCLKAYPNGYDISNLDKSNTFLRLASFPPNVGVIAMLYTVGLRETNTKFSAVERFSDTSPSFGWTANLLKFEAQIKNNENLKSFTYFTIIRIIDIFDINGNVITDQFMNTTLNDEDMVNIDSIRNMKICKYFTSTPFKYEWKITDSATLNAIKQARNGKNFLSPIFSLFGLKWYLEFIPVPSDRDPEFPGSKLSEKEDLRDFTILYFCAASYHQMLKKLE